MPYICYPILPRHYKPLQRWVFKWALALSKYNPLDFNSWGCFPYKIFFMYKIWQAVETLIKELPRALFDLSLHCLQWHQNPRLDWIREYKSTEARQMQKYDVTTKHFVLFVNENITKTCKPIPSWIFMWDSAYYEYLIKLIFILAHKTRNFIVKTNCSINSFLI